MNVSENVLTDFEFKPIETDKTDKTDCVSNQGFMLAVFGESTSDYRPLIVSFAGNPAQVHRSAWFGKPWVSNNLTIMRKLSSPRRMKDTEREAARRGRKAIREVILKLNMTRKTDSYPGLNRTRSHGNKTRSPSGF